MTWDPTRGGHPTQPVRPVPHARAAPRPPQPVAQVNAFELAGRVPSGDSVVQRVTRAVTRGFANSKQPRDLVTALNGVQAPVTTGRRVAVTSARGGAGKTAVSALVGSVFAARRADPVVAVDAAPETGSLAWRLGTQPRGTLAELAQGLMAASSRNLADVARLLPRTPSGLWVVPGGSAGQRTIARDVTRALSRLFAVAVLDCGTGMQLPETTEVLADAHAVLVVTPATPDGVSSTVSALSGVQPGALQRVVIALNATDPHGHATLKSGPAREAFQRMGVPVVELPYDRHVAAGAVIDPGKIAETTFVAAANLAAWALHRAPQL